MITSLLGLIVIGFAFCSAVGLPILLVKFFRSKTKHGTFAAIVLIEVLVGVLIQLHWEDTNNNVGEGIVNSFLKILIVVSIFTTALAAAHKSGK